MREWPDEGRINNIGQNGNNGDHYKMTTFNDRLFAERDELQAKIEKLTVACNNGRCYPQVSRLEYVLMDRQLTAMKEYYTILERRCDIR